MSSFVEVNHIRATSVNPACGAFAQGNRYHDHLGKMALAADMPCGWDGRSDYCPEGKPRAERAAKSVQSAPRVIAQPREAVVYAWETMVAQAGARAASEMFRRAAARRSQCGDRLATQHRLAGYLPAA